MTERGAPEGPVPGNAGAGVLETATRKPAASGWAYPVGLEVLREALAGAPQLGELELAFGGWRGSASSLAGARRRGKPYLIAEARYRIPDGERRDAGRPGGAWSLTVHTVPNASREAAREALVREGLPRIRAWLAEHGASGDPERAAERWRRRGGGRLEVHLRERDGALSYVERTAGRTRGAAGADPHRG